MTDPSSLSHLSREERALLFERLREKKKRTGGPEGRIPRRPPDLDPVPLSFAQERFWLLDRLMPGTVAYNVVLAMGIEGALDPAALGGALRELVRRHETLRTTYGERQGRGVQIIAPASSAASRHELPMADLSALPAAVREPEVERLAAGEAGRPFDLRRGPVLRTTLLRRGASRHVLLLEVHHIATDGWSMGVMTREIPALYTAAAAGRPSPLPEPALQYADFGLWQRQWLTGEVLERQLSYWRARLAGLPSLQLPTDRPRPAEPSFRGADLQAVVGKEGMRGAVRALARQLEVSPFMVLLAACQALLERYTGQRDFAVGTPVANRNRAEVEGVIGCFINSLVLRGDLHGDPPFTELVARARKTALEAFAHQDLPFDRLVEELRPERRLSHNPLYQVSVGLQNAPAERVKLPGLELETLESHAPASRFDLESSFWEQSDDETLVLQLNYSTDLFDVTTVERLAAHLGVLLSAVLEDPGRCLSVLPLLTGHETQQVLHEWNDTAAALPSGGGATLVDLFRQQAVRRPGAAAVSSAEGDLSYADLDARSERLARRLAVLGVGPELPVALVADRTHAMVVGVLAILKAGGAYMPLDPTYPAERLSWMLADSGALILLGEPALLETLPAGVWAPVVVELTADPEETDPDAALAGPLPDALAYIMYTSGSTGQPKGVGVTHRNVVRLVRGSGFADLGPEQTFLQLAPISFDAATLEIWAPLANGGRLALPPPGPLSLDEIGHAIESRGVTSLWLTAGLFHQMVEHRLESLRPLSQLLAGGDVLSPAHVERTLTGLPGLALINGYGPTEGTTFTTCHAMTAASRPAAGVSIPIGRPIGNTRVLVLDREMRPVPMGIYGELCAAGDGVARGYMGRPEMTAERFAPNPLGGPGERLYRTGNLARFRPSGVVEFLGRRDGQVKLRGYRVELGEIEAVLARHPEVRAAAVALREDADRPGDRRLVAYVVPRSPSPSGTDDGAELETALTAALRRLLGEELPEYMVPSAFVAMTVLPLSPNGKVDRAVLPAPPGLLGAGAAGAGARGYVPPQTPVEVRIAGLYAEVLGLERVGLQDDFFDLGGHSLLATQVVSRLRDSLGVELPLYKMFESPAVAGLARLVEDELALLAAGAAAEVAPPIVPVPRDMGDGGLPLSFAQERLWILDRLIPGSAAYNIPLALSIEGALEPAALEAALREMVRRHETLRTTFGERHGKPVQSIAPPPVRWELPLADLTALPAAARMPEARRLAEAEAARPFDLERGPVLRTTLLRLDGRQHALLLDIHHIASDGWSMGVMTREIAPLYAAAAAGRPLPPPELPELAVQYADFAVWQRRWLAGAVLERQLAYWREKLAALPALELPLDRPRPAAPTFRGVTFSHPLSAVLTREARTRARQQDATLFMVLLAAFQALLERFTGQSDFAVGSPIANRNRAEVEPLIGFFVNSLVLRGDLTGDPSFSALVERTRKTALEAFSYQDLPFERLVEELRPERRLTHNPLFQVVFAVQNAPVDRIDLPDLSLAPLESSSPSSRFDLEVTFWEVGEELLALVTYGTDLLDDTTVRRLVGHLETLLLGAVENPARPLSRLPLVQEAEAHQVLREWNDTARALPAATVVDLFREQARRRPAAIAVSSVEGDLTYAELDARSSRLARRLAGLGLRTDEPVGLLAERSQALVVGLLGILAAGGSYLPLDASYPAERLAWMLSDSGARILLGEPEKLAALPAGARPATVERVVELAAGPDDVEGPAPGGPLPGSLAYVLYTSGSTGRPKAVGITHGNIVRLVREAGYGPTGPDEVHLHLAPLSFDASTFEIWPPLANGGRLVLAPPGRLSLDEMGRVIQGGGVTTLLLTTGLFNQMVDHRPDSLRGVRQLLTGGEALSPVHGERALAGLPGVTLINVYGPTEATVFISTHAMRRPEEVGRPVSIGRPAGNTRVVLLDQALRPLPMGVVGELCAGGAGVARGYIGRPDLTAERFVPDATGGGGERLYRTGDLARLRADGRLDFLGRRDGQVKLRGFRVELGEVEAALARHPEVGEAAVVVREDRPGDRRLVAYVVPRAAGGKLPVSWRDFLAASLPEHMIPAAFVVLPALPLTANGKLDRTALPAPERPAAEADAFVPPETALEERLAALYAEVLGVERVGRHDGFFDLGGHSLLATQVMSRLRDTLGIDLPLRRLFEFPSVAGLARVVEDETAGAADFADSADGATMAAGAIPRAARDEPLPLSFAQERLWFLDRLMNGGVAYSLPMALRLAGGLDIPALAAALTGIVRRHESLRTVFTLHPSGSDEAVQVVQPVAEVWRQPLPVMDLSGLGHGSEEEARRLAVAEAARPFDLRQGPLLRTALVRLAPRDHLLLVNMHHIVSDAWSLGVMVRELEALYAAGRTAGRSLAAALPELPIQYPDFAVWQRRRLAGEGLERHLGYWRGRLAGAPPLDLPADRPRPAVQSFRGAARRFDFGAGLSERLNALARRQAATPFMVLAAGLVAVLARTSGQPDISIGAPIANRNRTETEGLIGFFVNNLVLRADVGSAASFRDLLEQVREVTLGAYAHQDLPFEKLVEELHPERDPSRTPLFQVTLAFQNAPLPAIALEDLEIVPQDLPGATAKFDLSFSVGEAGGLLAGGVEYVTDLYDGSTVQRFCRHWLRLLASALEDPAAAPAVLPLLSGAERHQLLREWNDTAFAPGAAGADVLLHQLFEARVDAQPGSPAAVWGDESLTYGGLEERANRLAALLRRLGVERGAPVGIWMERSLDMLVAVLGTLKAGATYVPIDAGWPAERAEAVLGGSGSAAILTGRSHLRRVQELQWRLPLLDDAVCLDVATAALPAEPVDQGEVRSLWDVVAERAVDWVTAAGFYSSYTGEPFSEAEVLEYRDRVLALAAPSVTAGGRVLEIGCGSGLILWELAPALGETGRYVGLDPSERTQQANRERAAREGLAARVELITGFAHEIDRFAAGSFDLVILASTAQFFPGPVYLERVLERALDLLAPGGAVVVADLLDPRRRDDFQRSLVEHAAVHPGSAAATRLATSGGAGSGPELAVDEGLFLDLGAALPELGEVVIHRREEGFANELRFRYDVVLKKAAAPHDAGQRRKRVWTGAHVAECPAARPVPIASPVDLAYVIHTSGSTGQPKGIAVQHRPAVELARWVNRTFGVGPDDRLLFITSLAFDLSVYDVFGVLGAGGVVHVAPEEALRDPQRLARMLVEERVTLWDSAPAALQQLAPLFPAPPADGGQSRLRLVLLSGDWIPVPLPDQVRAAFPGARVIALGGATEATVWSNWFPVGAVDPAWPSIPYGRPIDGARYHVLDAGLAPCPIGVPGDLYIGGRCLCVGYTRLPETTAERFLPDPFAGAGEPGARLYATGDRARYGRDGNLEFLGRVDQQVKVRGYRIELEEIEAVLVRQPGVREAVVAVREDVPGERRLVGYVVPARQPAPAPQELRSSLQQSLPEYMVPWTFVMLESLPLTANGKVDRKALPPPPADGGRSYAAPRNELERTIAAVWREVLGLAQVGVHDNLFELGGTSLLVVKLHGRLQQELGRELPMMELFRHTTIDALARALAGDAPQRETGTDEARVRTQTRRESLAQLNEARSRRRTRPE